ncbi:MAG: fumarate hydratase [Acidobacteria bacterium]|nr:fumarate hydratase [Acidobacteriota bacterium]
MRQFKSSIYDLIVQTSTNLPPDVRAAMASALERETPGTQASSALEVIATNIDMAASCEGPICQDTGMLTFEIRTPVGANQLVMERSILEAVAEATKSGKLRPNSVDSITGKNSGNNLGPGTPIIHWNQWEAEDEMEVRLILKGGGCENTSAQYSVPCELPHLGRADRDLDGVRKCILHAVWKAQGQGCSAGAIGVCVGGDRSSGYHHAKQQLFRLLDDVNPDPVLAALEEYIMRAANTLGIGTMGFGGGVTLIGCKIGALNRLPASFFVSVAYDCWAFRRLGAVLDASTGAIRRWLYRDERQPVRPMSRGAGFVRTGKEVPLRPPVSEPDIRRLKVGDIVLIQGDMYTGRDAVHSHLMKYPAPVDLAGGIIYHCGPVVLKDNGSWKITAAGPTTSIREEPYQADIMKKYRLRAVIGKGGMGPKTLAGLKENGGVYLNAIGGAAQYYARCIKRVKGVYFLEEFGVPEAMWHIEVEDFPAIVTMDANGNSLHADVEKASGAILANLADPVF